MHIYVITKASIYKLELVRRLAKVYGMDKKHPLPIQMFTCATVTVIVTNCNNYISPKNDRPL